MESKGAVTALSALAQETRLAIFRILVHAGVDGLAVGRVGDTDDLPSATLSFHLKELKHAGFVAVRRNGRSLVYGTNFSAMNELIDNLTRTCCQGDPVGFVPRGATPAVSAERRMVRSVPET